VEGQAAVLASLSHSKEDTPQASLSLEDAIDVVEAGMVDESSNMAEEMTGDTPIVIAEDLKASEQGKQHD
jgi:hypothetical protein